MKAESAALSLLLCQAIIARLCATGFASVPHLQEALAKPVAHINTRMTEDYAAAGMATARVTSGS